MATSPAAVSPQDVYSILKTLDGRSIAEIPFGKFPLPPSAIIGSVDNTGIFHAGGVTMLGRSIPDQKDYHVPIDQARRLQVFNIEAVQKAWDHPFGRVLWFDDFENANASAVWTATTFAGGTPSVNAQSTTGISHYGQGKWRVTPIVTTPADADQAGGRAFFMNNADVGAGGSSENRLQRVFVGIWWAASAASSHRRAILRFGTDDATNRFDAGIAFNLETDDTAVNSIEFLNTAGSFEAVGAASGWNAEGGTHVIRPAGAGGTPNVAWHKMAIILEIKQNPGAYLRYTAIRFDDFIARPSTATRVSGQSVATDGRRQCRAEFAREQDDTATGTMDFDDFILADLTADFVW